MILDELITQLESSEDGKINITKYGSEYTFARDDETKLYILGLEKRLSRVSDFVIWPCFIGLAAILILANTEVVIINPYVAFIPQWLSGWLAGSLVFCIIFAVFMMASNHLIKKSAPQYKAEFYERSRRLDFSRDQLLSAEWMGKTSAINVSEMLMNGTFETYR